MAGKRRPLAASALVALTIVLGIASAATTGAGAADPKRGGTLTIGTAEQVLGFDIVTTKTSTFVNSMVGGMVFGTFYGLDEHGQQYPSEALSAQASEDGLTWRVKLRPGMRFSDGSPYDAGAIAKHWVHMLDSSRNQAFAQYVTAYKEVIAIDPVTLEFRMNHPWGGFAPTLSYNTPIFWVMPPQHEASAGPELNRKPIGAGPYMLEEWNQDGGMVLVRNPQYWNADAQHFDKIIIKYIPDENSRYAAVKNGDVDITGGTLQQVQDARKNPALQVVRQEATGAFDLIFNTTTAPLDDVRVRQALAYATDRNAYKKVIMSDEGEMANSFWGKGSPWHCDVEYPEYDPAKAQSLLKEYDKPVKISLQVPASPIGVLIGELYQSFWKKVGVETELVQLQIGPAYIGPVFAGKFQAVLWDVPDLPDPDRQVHPVFRSGSGANVTKTNDPVLDDALDRGRFTMDTQARKTAYCDFAREFNRYLPALLRDRHIYYAIANAKLRVAANLGFGRYWPAFDWWEK
jgi:ABC-type transport system substrate-binding protein